MEFNIDKSSDAKYYDHHKEDTVFIMAADGGYYYDGFQSEGYKVFTLYKRSNIIQRIIREICFRIPFFSNKIWYDKKVLSVTPKNIIILDTLTTKKYLLWLKNHFPNAQINFLYNNMVGNARHLKPKEIPKGIRVWTYDGYDSKKFNIRLKKTNPYFLYFVHEPSDKTIDVLFVGRDKGRGEKLLKFENWLNVHGQKTQFIITKDGKFKKNKPYYKSEISYDENVCLVSKSKAVLNVTMKNQQGITLRDLECLFNKVKLITTNVNIVDADFYNKKNIFILGVDNIEELPTFINSRYDEMPIDMSLHSAEAMVKEITDAE